MTTTISTVQVKDLSRNHLIEVFHTNHQLQEDLRADFYDKQIGYINEIKQLFEKGIEQCVVSLFGYNKLIVNFDETDSFVLGAVKAQEIYSLLPDVDVLVIHDAVRRMNDIAYATREEYIAQNDSYIESLERLAGQISKKFHEILSQSQQKHELFDYFISHYAQESLQNAYVNFDADGNSDYILRESNIIEKTYN